jgi:hypothetical protein
MTLNFRSLVSSIVTVTIAVGIPVITLGGVPEQAVASSAPRRSTPPKTTSPASQSSDWMRFTATQGRFSILMRKDPIVSKIYYRLTDDPKSKEMEGWGVIAADTYQSRDGFKALYFVGYFDSPTQNATDNPMMSQAFEKALRNSQQQDGAKLISRSKLSLKGYPGEELRYQYKSGWSGRVRRFLVGKRWYYINVVTDQETNLQKTIDNFMESFQLL